ncbi:MAG: FMN-binding protein [Phycisphaerales bacterium]|jgi:Na+-translocating ferredoxin:NAD+ oxidoreductase subunit G|nr:FMN-binding protein [Phycisphaerales bacterium]
MSDTKKGNYLVQAWLVLLLATSFGAAMAGVHIALNPRILENQKNKTYNQIPLLIPDSSKDRVEEGKFSVEVGGAQVERKFYRALAPDGESTMGYMLRASGMGYVDKIEVLIGVDAKVKNITGIYVLSQIETPGLGNKIRSEDFESKFIYKSTTQGIFAQKTAQPPESNDIQAITSATISSQSVCSIVSRSVREFREYLDASIQRELALANIPKMFPGTKPEQIKDFLIDGRVVYQVFDDDDEVKAWIAGGKRMGRWDRIDLLVAVDPPAQTISKVYILDQRERWWKKVAKAGYVESFTGKKADTIITMVKPGVAPDEHQVQAVTKATVTSTTICRIVNDVVSMLKTSTAKIPGGSVVKE